MASNSWGNKMLPCESITKINIQYVVSVFNSHTPMSCLFPVSTMYWLFIYKRAPRPIQDLIVLVNKRNSHYQIYSTTENYVFRILDSLNNIYY